MKPYIDMLKAKSARQLAEEQLHRRYSRKTVVTVQWQPLEVQIQRWWQDLPDTLKQRRYQIADIAGVCKGRYREKPAYGAVAKALRNTGWKAARDWSNSGRNRRFWLKA